MNQLVHIQILRAIAVVSVIVFHMKESFYPLGYLGVDIFFVISGFVITKSIDSSHQRSHFSLLNFYSRRILRIFPVLFFMLVVVFFIHICIATYHEQWNFFDKKPWYSALQISNWFYSSFRSTYWDSKTLNPFLHTWSLGVEEQFYLVYPLILMVLYVLKVKNNIRLVVLLLLVVVSVYFYWVSEPKIRFYMPYTKAYGFLLGGIIYFIRDKVFFKNKIIIKWIYYLSLSGLIIILSLSKDFNKPTINILTVLLTSWVIWLSCKMENRFIFGSNVITKIGDISYSLYLWHLPIIIMYKMLHLTISGENLSKIDYLIIGFMTFVISIMSFKYIEKPFRNIRIRHKQYSLLSILTGISLMIGLFFVFKIPYHHKMKHFQNDYENNFKRVDFSKYNFKKNDFGYKDTVGFIGDSHAQEIVPSMIKWAKKNKVNIYNITHGLTRTFDINKKDSVQKYYKEMLEDLTLKKIIIKKYSGYSGYSGYTYFDEMTFYLNYISLIRPDLPITIIEDHKKLFFNPYNCTRSYTLIHKIKFLQLYLSGDKCMIMNHDKFESNRKRLNKFVKEYQLKGYKIGIIYNNYSRLKYNGKWLYRDDNHLNQWGTKYFETTPLYDFK